MNEETLDSMEDDGIEEEIVHCEDVELAMKDAIAEIDFWLDGSHLQCQPQTCARLRTLENNGRASVCTGLYELKSHLEGKSLINAAHHSSSPAHHISAGTAPHSEVNLVEESLCSKQHRLFGAR